jgi:mRNA-degrading endonuclease toxin of MazEF toxin-antitoxin module
LSTKEILYREIENASPEALEEVLNYLKRLISEAHNVSSFNSDKLAKHIGVLNDEDAAELHTIINKELNTA